MGAAVRAPGEVAADSAAHAQPQRLLMVSASPAKGYVTSNGSGLSAAGLLTQSDCQTGGAGAQAEPPQHCHSFVSTTRPCIS